MKNLSFRCPNCTVEHTIVFKNVARGMVENLIKLCRIHSKAPGQWVNVKDTEISENDCSKLFLWGLVQTAPPIGKKKKSGLWVPTQQGWDFATNQLAIPKSVRTVQGAIIGYDDALVQAQPMLGSKYDHLWAG